jgi:hypothetical protein
MARSYYVVLLVLFVALAGCAGGGGPAADGATPTASGGSGDGSGNSGGGSGSGSSGDTTAVWAPYEFRQGEYYEYELTESGQSQGTFYWEVLSVDDESVTVRFSGDMDGEQFETTATGAPESIYSNFVTTPGGSAIFVAFYGPFVGPFAGEALTVGQSWSYTSANETLEYSIERSDSVAGRDVVVSVVRFNGVVEYETWIDTELALAAKTVIYTDGEEDMLVELVDYRN